MLAPVSTAKGRVDETASDETREKRNPPDPPTLRPPLQDGCMAEVEAAIAHLTSSRFADATLRRFVVCLSLRR